MTSLAIKFKIKIQKMSTVALPEKKQPKSKIVLAQALAGFATGFLVSPLNTVVDKSVMEYANKKHPTIWQAAGSSIKTLLTKPVTFLKSFEFRWMCFVYFPTFSVSNVADHFNVSDSIPHPIQKLLAVFSVNTVTSLLKDRVYIQKLNPHKAIEPVPLSSLSLLFTRDIIAMAAAFIVPSLAAEYFNKHHKMSYTNTERFFQLALPPGLQIFVVPIHLLALGLYNQQQRTMGEQFAAIKKLYWNTVALRMMRFLPSYGFGGIFNIELRKYLKSRIPHE